MLEALVGAALRTLLLAVLVEFGLRILRVRHAQLLLAAWTAVLMASLAMPLVQRYVLITVPVAVDLPLSLADLPGGESPAVAAVNMAAVSGVPPAVAASVHGEPAWRLWLSAGYLMVTGAMLLRLMVGLVLSFNLLRAARPIRDSWTSETWASETWAAGGRVRASAAIAAPVTVGGSIVLPSDCRNWTAAMQRAVLAHERAHVAGGDFYVLLLSQLNRALFWFNPLSWWLHRRLASLAELASDDAAMQALGDGPGYAAILLDMGRRSGPVLGGVAMARPATLPRRIERILAQDERQLPVPWRQRAAYGIGVAPLALATAISIAGAAPPNKAAVDEQREPHTPIAIDPKLLDAYAGFYRNAATGSVMIVTRDGDHLLTGRAGQPRVSEYPYTDRDFFLTVASQQNSFVTDASGAVVRVVHHQMGQTETLERLSTEDGQREVAAFTQRLQAQRAPHAEVAIDPQLLDGYVGTYQLNPRLIFTITRDGNKLFARLTGQQTYEVHPYSDRDFFYTIVAAQLSFVVGADGKASAVILRQYGLDRTAERVDPALAQALDRKLGEQHEPHTAIAIDPRLIDRYVGRYLNDAQEMTASRDGNQLFLQVTGYGRYPVYPYTDHDFFATIMPAQVSFVTDQTGRATQLIRHLRGKDIVLNRVE
jgi:beta-lactamase regulating signal transducer with metallopeptidase domain